MLDVIQEGIGQPSVKIVEAVFGAARAIVDRNINTTVVVSVIVIGEVYFFDAVLLYVLYNVFV